MSFKTYLQKLLSHIAVPNQSRRILYGDTVTTNGSSAIERHFDVIAPFSGIVIGTVEAKADIVNLKVNDVSYSQIIRDNSSNLLLAYQRVWGECKKGDTVALYILCTGDGTLKLEFLPFNNT